MTLTADSISWNKAYEHTVDLTFHTNDAGVGGRYYVTWVKKSDSTPGFEAVKSNYKSSGDIASSASVQLTDVAYDTAIKVVVYAEMCIRDRHRTMLTLISPIFRQESRARAIARIIKRTIMVISSLHRKELRQPWMTEFLQML